MKMFSRGLAVLLYLTLFSIGTMQAQELGVPGQIERSLTWYYGGQQYKIDCNFSPDEYSFYKGMSKVQPYQYYAEEYDNHRYFLSLAQKLDEASRGTEMSNYKFAEYLTAFVQQCVPYVPDPETLGHDYPRFPIETLVDRGGDCEDKAALLLALMKTFGYDVKMVEFTDHVAAAIAHPEAHGSRFHEDGKNYFYIETTAPMQIGEITPAKSRQAAMLVNVAQSTYYNRQTGYAANTAPTLAVTEKPKPFAAIKDRFYTWVRLGTINTYRAMNEVRTSVKAYRANNGLHKHK